MHIDNRLFSEISEGFVVFLAVKDDDSQEDLDYIVKKSKNLRIFEDENGKMNLSILDVKGQVMIVSQFTLYGDCRKGNRPNYMLSAKSEIAIPMYESYIEEMRNEIEHIATGQFGADMEVVYANDGPVTIQLDSRKEY